MALLLVAPAEAGAAMLLGASDSLAALASAGATPVEGVPQR